MKVENWNSVRPIGSMVWIEDGSEHRRKAVIVRPATIREDCAVAVVSILSESSVDIPQFSGSPKKLATLARYAEENGTQLSFDIEDVYLNPEYP